MQASASNGAAGITRHSSAATRVIAGSVPVPLVSSRARGWDGLTLELHSFNDLDTIVQPADHVIAIHLAGEVNLRRTRENRTSERAMRAGDVTITPVGPPVRWRQQGHSLSLLMRLSPAYMRTVAQEDCTFDPERADLRSEFSTRDAVIGDIGRGLLAALEVEGTDSRVCADSLTAELGIHLLRRYTHSGAVRTPSSRLSPHKLRIALQYIEANLCRELTLAALAGVVALSPGHFAHAFRAATGVAPHRYIVLQRVERAKRLLRESDLPITEIADRIGCSSHSHFSVLFHRVTGVTPRQFRSHV